MSGCGAGERDGLAEDAVSPACDEGEPAGSPKRPRIARALLALVLAAACAAALGGFAYASGGVSKVNPDDEVSPVDGISGKEDWIKLEVTRQDDGRLLAASSSVRQSIAVRNNVLGEDGKDGYTNEAAYVRVHVALPSAVNDLDGDAGDDIVQASLIAPATSGQVGSGSGDAGADGGEASEAADGGGAGEAPAATPWSCSGSYETIIHGVPCTVRVFVYGDVLPSGGATSALAETFTVNPLCEVGGHGASSVFIKDGARFECDGGIPVYVLSEAVQASAWKTDDGTAADAGDIAAILNESFGVPGEGYRPTSWAAVSEGA